MRRISVFSALALGLLLAGCGAGSPVESPSATSAPTAIPTLKPTPTMPPEVAGFLLSGSELISVDAAGDPIDRISLSDLDAVIGELTEFYGTPHSRLLMEGCGVVLTSWPGENGPISVYQSDWPADNLIILRPGVPSTIRPSAGPTVGESALEFIATLPADQYQEGYSYIYDVATIREDGYPVGGAAFIDSDGIVDHINSPHDGAGGHFC